MKLRMKQVIYLHVITSNQCIRYLLIVSEDGLPAKWGLGTEIWLSDLSQELSLFHKTLTNSTSWLWYLVKLGIYLIQLMISLSYGVSLVQYRSHYILGLNKAFTNSTGCLKNEVV